MSLPLQTLAAPGLRAVVTHKWLEAFVARTVAAGHGGQQQQGKGKRKGKAPVVCAAVDVGLPLLAE